MWVARELPSSSLDTAAQQDTMRSWQHMIAPRVAAPPESRKAIEDVRDWTEKSRKLRFGLTAAVLVTGLAEEILHGM